MALLESYNINAMATQISREFFIKDNPAEDKSYVLMDEMRLFAMDMKSRVTFISRTKESQNNTTKLRQWLYWLDFLKLVFKIIPT